MISKVTIFVLSLVLLLLHNNIVLSFHGGTTVQICSSRSSYAKCIEKRTTTIIPKHNVYHLFVKWYRQQQPIYLYRKQGLEQCESISSLNLCMFTRNRSNQNSILSPPTSSRYWFPTRFRRRQQQPTSCSNSTPLKSSMKSDSDNKDILIDSTKSIAKEDASLTKNNIDDDDDTTTILPVAQIGTVNERLMAELEEARRKELYGARSTLSSNSRSNKKQKKNSFSSVILLPSQRKTDEERKAAIADAKNLNGINPFTAYIGACIALGSAYLLWIGTTMLAENFAYHPVQDITDIYFIQRLTSVYRNIIIGLISLCAGFFGVTGIGILLLAIRVSYGVLIGELDPTPTVESSSKTTTRKDNEEPVLSNVWDLMMNKKRGRK